MTASGIMELSELFEFRAFEFRAFATERKGRTPRLLISVAPRRGSEHAAWLDRPEAGLGDALDGWLANRRWIGNYGFGSNRLCGPCPP